QGQWSDPSALETKLNVREIKRRGKRVPGGLLKLAIIPIITTERLNDGQSGKRLLDQGIDPAFEFLLVIAAVKHWLSIRAKGKNHKRYDGDRQQRESLVDPPHDQEHCDEIDESRPDGQQ